MNPTVILDLLGSYASRVPLGAGALQRRNAFAGGRVPLGLSANAP